MKIYEIVKQKDLLEKELKNISNDFKLKKGDLEKQINDLKRLEDVGALGLDLEKIQLAEKTICIKGNPYGKTSEVLKFGYNSIAEQAIIDIANNCPHLKTKYFGNKVYGSFYQQESHNYEHGPRHGTIVDKISLLTIKRDLTEQEKDACIYYLKNYKKLLENKLINNV